MTIAQFETSVTYESCSNMPLQLTVTRFHSATTRTRQQLDKFFNRKLRMNKSKCYEIEKPRPQIKICFTIKNKTETDDHLNQLTQYCAVISELITDYLPANMN
jgi:hypothetical protein